jgi:hypothetical protein
MSAGIHHSEALDVAGLDRRQERTETAEIEVKMPTKHQGQLLGSTFERNMGQLHASFAGEQLGSDMEVATCS